MERLIDTLECTHKEKRRCEEENYEYLSKWPHLKYDINHSNLTWYHLNSIHPRRSLLEVVITQPWKRRALSPTRNLHSGAAAVSYISSYSWNIPKPALIKNAKVLAIAK